MRPRLRHAVPALRALALGVGLAVACAHAQAPADLRVALVIGNAAYAAAPLANAANDARAMGEALRSMGFRVIESRDASKAQMEAALGRASDALKGKNGIGMLYYAGHGLQLDWHNYMVPVDARFASAADVPAQTVDVQAVIDAFRSAGSRMNILVLDACRDNPFGATASAKGLAPMDAPPGTFLAYATAPGNVAEDGDATSGNGLYTRFLVRELKAPQARIEDVFKRVRFEVRRQSQGRQVPWESTSLEDDFYFDLRVPEVRLADAERALAATQALIAENADWDRVKDSPRADDLYAFLQKYPNGLISEQAQFRLDQLQQTRVQAQPGADGVVQLKSGRNRYAMGDEFVQDTTNRLTNITTRSTARVTFADDTRVEINRGSTVLDQMGGTLQNASGRKSPVLLLAPAELSVGKHWRTAFTNTTPDGVETVNYYDLRVTAFEEISVPAGTFRAFKVERSGEARAQNAYTVLTGTAWIDPSTMMTVRNDTIRRRAGKIIYDESVLLVSMRRQTAQAADLNTPPR